MKKLEQIKEHIQNGKKLSKIPGITPLTKIEEIALRNPLIWIKKLKNDSKNGSLAKANIIIPESINNLSNYVDIEGIFYTPLYDFEEAKFQFIGKKGSASINKENININNDYMKQEWYYMK